MYVESARRLNAASVVGGDFQTQLHVCQRGERLMQTARMFSMVIANANQEHETGGSLLEQPSTVSIQNGQAH